MAGAGLCILVARTDSSHFELNVGIVWDVRAGYFSRIYERWPV